MLSPFRGVACACGLPAVRTWLSPVARARYLHVRTTVGPPPGVDQTALWRRRRFVLRSRYRHHCEYGQTPGVLLHAHAAVPGSVAPHCQPVYLPQSRTGFAGAVAIERSSAAADGCRCVHHAGHVENARDGADDKHASLECRVTLLHSKMHADGSRVRASSSIPSLLSSTTHAARDGRLLMLAMTTLHGASFVADAKRMASFLAAAAQHAAALFCFHPRQKAVFSAARDALGLPGSFGHNCNSLLKILFLIYVHASKIE